MNPMRSRHVSCVAHAPRFGLYLTAVPHARISYPTPPATNGLLSHRNLFYNRYLDKKPRIAAALFFSCSRTTP